MPGYRFARAAEDDLEGIVDYTLQRWGVDQANQYLDGLDQQAQSLAENPKIGKSCDDLGTGLQFFPYQSHVLYYLEDAHGITIARVLHESMNPSLHLKDDDSV
jgi:toxin ParE1/3/4